MVRALLSPINKFYTLTINIMTKWHFIHWLRTWKNRFSRIYQWIKRRCNNPNDAAYPNYGGRWIKCERNNIEEFYNDMYPSYIDHIKEYGEEDTTIDRIDNDKNYCKENCRRATMKEQQNNRSNNKFYIINWEEFSIWQFAEKYWISRGTAARRLMQREKWNISFESLTRYGIIWSKWVEVDGKFYSFEELCDITWVCRDTILSRVFRYKNKTMDKEWLFRSQEEINSKFNSKTWIILNWKMYNCATLAEEIWLDRVAARKRIKLYKEWKMPDYIVLHKGWLPSNWRKVLIKN